jgi:hypothetical protein
MHILICPYICIYISTFVIMYIYIQMQISIPDVEVLRKAPNIITEDEYLYPPLLMTDSESPRMNWNSHPPTPLSEMKIATLNKQFRELRSPQSTHPSSPLDNIKNAPNVKTAYNIQHVRASYKQPMTDSAYSTRPSSPNSSGKGQFERAPLTQQQSLQTNAPVKRNEALTLTPKTKIERANNIFYDPTEIERESLIQQEVLSCQIVIIFVIFMSFNHVSFWLGLCVLCVYIEK